MNENYMFQALEWQSKCKSDQEVDCKKLDDELNEAFDEIIKSTTSKLLPDYDGIERECFGAAVVSLTFLCHKKVFLLLCCTVSQI